MYRKINTIDFLLVLSARLRIIIISSLPDCFEAKDRCFESETINIAQIAGKGGEEGEKEEDEKGEQEKEDEEEQKPAVEVEEEEEEKEEN